MSRLGAAKKRARERGIKGQSVKCLIVDDPHRLPEWPSGPYVVSDPETWLRRVRESVESSGERIDGAAIERALFATPVPASQGQRARMLVLGLLLVACIAWWALAVWEVLR